jgi:hypothetical protein
MIVRHVYSHRHLGGVAFGLAIFRYEGIWAAGPVDRRAGADVAAERQL